MDSKSLTAIIPSQQETNELEQQGLRLKEDVQTRLGRTYQVCHNNPQSYGFTVYLGDRECGGFAWLGQWVHIYGAADAPSGDVAFVKVAIDNAISSLEVA